MWRSISISTFSTHWPFGPLKARPATERLSGVARGRMLSDQVVRLLGDVARAACDVVGLAITEHLPWDTLAIRNMLRRLPLMKLSLQRAAGNTAELLTG